MSALATFELPKGVEPPTLALHAAWRGEFVSILVEQNGRTTVGLGHWYGGDAAAQQLQAAVRVLLADLAGRPLYYFRDADCMEVFQETDRRLKPGGARGRAAGLAGIRCCIILRERFVAAGRTEEEE